MKAKKILSWGSGVAGIILLGAIANGVWSGIMSPALSWLVDIVMRSLSSISEVFKNRIYAEAAKGFHEAISFDIYILILWAVVGFLTGVYVVLCNSRFQLSGKQASPFTFSGRRFLIASMMLLIVIVLSLFNIIKTNYTNKITTQSLNSVEIIAPFLEQKEYLSIKSAFLRIKKAEDYEDFHRKMVELSEEHEIELPLFEPL